MGRIATRLLKVLRRVFGHLREDDYYSLARALRPVAGLGILSRNEFRELTKEKE